MARVVYDFYMTQAARALEIACDRSEEKIVPSKSPLKDLASGIKLQAELKSFTNITLSYTTRSQYVFRQLNFTNKSLENGRKF